MLLTRAQAYAFGILAAILLVTTIGLSLHIWGLRIGPLGFDGLKGKLHDTQFNLNECRAGRTEDRLRYENAQREAELKNKAQVERIKTDQERVTDEVSRDLNSRLERLRRELRAQGSAAGRPPHGTEAGPVPNAAGGSDEAAGVCLAPDEQLRAAENEERFDQLITWVEQQSKVAR